jgi:hypothetical protein
VAGGDDIEGELALEFGDRLLLGAAATDERVEGRQQQRQGVIGLITQPLVVVTLVVMAVVGFMT